MPRLNPPQPGAYPILPLLMIIVSLVAGGCGAVWQPTSGRLVTPAWSIEAPDGWVRLSTTGYEMLSKDGPYLQYILIQQRPLDHGFRYTHNRLRADMLPQEMARVVVDNLRSDPQIRDFDLVENLPATVGGRPGFKLIFTYQDLQGVDMRTIYYGAVDTDHFFNLRYTATQRHYFTADSDTFEKVVSSLRLASDA